MNDLSLFSAILMGLGATLSLDLWGIFLKHFFGITPSNICLLGRWLRYMQAGTFRHTHLPSAPRHRAECASGWVAHYITGVVFASVFVLIAGRDWLLHPRLIPAVLFGLGTVLMPFMIMQPAFGLGWAASKTTNPAQARLRTLINHSVFGVGLYLFGLLARVLA